MTLWILGGFVALVLVLVILDLGLITRRPRAITPTEATLSAQLWVVASVGFSILLYNAYHRNWLTVPDILREEPRAGEAFVQYLTAYLIEIFLSLDNIVVLVLLFAYFNVAQEHRGRALFWITLASLIVRGAMVLGGAALLAHGWARWVFVVMLLIAGVRAFVLPDRPSDLERRPFVKRAKTLFADGKNMWAVVAIAILADLSFALDSIPAVFSVTRDPLVAFTSNVMAVLALRSLFFSLQNVIGRIRYLKLGISFMLLGLAAKFAFVKEDTLLPTAITVGAIGGVLLASVLASIPHMRREPRETPAPIEDVAEAIAATRRNLRKLAVLVAGTGVLIGAIVIAPLPGPGFTILAPIGIAILATEFAWARTLLYKLKVLQDQTDRIAKRTSVWFVPVAIVGFWGGLAIASYLTHKYWEWNYVTVFVLGGGGFMPVAFWSFRTIKLHLDRRKAARAAAAGEKDPSSAPNPNPTPAPTSVPPKGVQP